MAKKRKSRGAKDAVPIERSKYDVDETFDDSQDEFFAGQDKILLDEAPASKRRRKLVEQEQHLQPSDEEVLAYESEQDSEVSFDQQISEQGTASEDEEEADDQIWGTSKSDYYNADAIETEADALDEEAEARRLQQKQLKGITDADFGFDEYSWNAEEQPTSKGKPVIEKLPDVTIPPNATEQDKLKILRSRYPELQPLARDFQDLQVVWTELQQTGAKSNGAKGVSNLTKLKALSAYLGAIVMYFAILTSQTKTDADESRITALPAAELHEHPVIGNLMRSKQLWASVRDIEVAPPIDETEMTPKIVNGISARAKAVREPQIKIAKSKTPNAIDSGRKTKEEKPQKSRTKGDKKKEKKQKSTRTDLEALLSQSALAQESEPSEFGDEAPLTEEQAAEKAQKKKSLRFYSSQILQKANRRGMASREAGGDDDVPHKERMRERQERLLREAERRGQQKATAEEELGGSDGEGDGVISGDDEYYQTLVAQSKQKKADKRAKAEAYAEAAREGGRVYEAEEVGPDGKRAITYAIEKNKGLMPKRKKDVRNPRVKKRHKFEEKKKKLGSIRQVYKGGEGRGGYGGELTGIKTNVVKSVKLS